MQHFPAVIIGGPPNSGKSILTANLTQALRQRNCPHYVLRASPDGEGDWTYLADQELVHTILIPHVWTPEFVAHICRDIERRQLPLLVDIGGRPQPWQEVILDVCTHAILLTPNATAAATWRDLVTKHGLRILAEIHSDLYGANQLETTSPTIRGVLAGLTWETDIRTPLFTALVERLSDDLFAYDPVELRQLHLSAAPVELTIDIDRLGRTLGIPFQGSAPQWANHHLSAILNYLPDTAPLAFYGRGTNWIYAAVALLSYPADFYQFDPRLGWVKTHVLRKGKVTHRILSITQQLLPDGVHLKFEISATMLDYSELPNLIVPELLPHQGVLLSGRLPYWLYTSLARTYQAQPWIAVYQPQLKGAVIVHTTTTAYAIGDLLPL